MKSEGKYWSGNNNCYCSASCSRSFKKSCTFS